MTLAYNPESIFNQPPGLKPGAGTQENPFKTGSDPGAPRQGRTEGAGRLLFARAHLARQGGRGQERALPFFFLGDEVVTASQFWPGWQRKT